MKLELKRIFVPNLPEVLTEKDVRERFFKFGNISSIEIKTRKNLGPRNHSHKFAFVNIATDHQSLQECFDEFSNKRWEGSYVEVQLAKESFLERLKKEREEAESKRAHSSLETTIIKSNLVTSSIHKNDLDSNRKRPASDTKSFDMNALSSKKNAKAVDTTEENSSSSSTNSSSEDEKVLAVVEPGPDYSDIVVKNNKFKKASTKIEGCGKSPIIIQQKQLKKKSKDPYREKADQKRLNSMHEMKKGYMQQKSTIQAALSNIDGKNSNKIVFNDEDDEVEGTPSSKVVNGAETASNIKQNGEKLEKKALFNAEDEDEDIADDDTTNFKMKEQFEGRKGKKLFELQTRFNQDERFKMDKRFAEDSSDSETSDNNNAHDDNEDSHQETRKQLTILGEVLGKKIESKTTNKSRKTMLRFDPNEPEHSKYEITEKKDADIKKKKKNKKSVEEKLPEVSRETFYQVSDSLKETQAEGEAFSFLKAFGNNDSENDKEEDAAVTKSNNEEDKGTSSKSVKKRSKHATPFKYDSSDEDEDEANCDKNKMKLESKTQDVAAKSQSVALGAGRLWTESFFYKVNDYRYQEGLDFIRRMAAQEEDGDYATVRRNFKRIVKQKVNSFQRKNQKMFRKKIGKFGKKRPKQGGRS